MSVKNNKLYKWPTLDVRRYKLIVFDVDGTLLEYKKDLDPFTRSVLLGLKGLGIPYTLATGKNLNATRSLAEDLRIELPMIFLNGCMLQNLDGTVHQKFVLPKEFVYALVVESEQMNLDLVFHIGEEIYVRKTTHNLSILKNYGFPELVEVGNWQLIDPLLSEVIKCLVINREDRKQLFELERRMRARIGNSIEICQSLPVMVEFMPKGITKMTGIRAITERMNISLESVMAFGDGNNDAEMLAAVGFGVAVENGAEMAKRSADLVVPSCAENGPAQFLNFLMRA